MMMFGLTAFSQEGQFSQYFATSSLLNPAFTGTIPNLTLNSNYKRSGNPNQQTFIELMQATVTYPFQKVTSKSYQTGGAAISFFRESRGAQGLYTLNKVLLTGAYRMRLTRLTHQYLVFGLQGGIALNGIDKSRLNWPSQFSQYYYNLGGIAGKNPDPNANPFNGTNDLLYPVFNFGVIYNVYDNENYAIRDKSLTIGFSIDNLNRPIVSYFPGEELRKFWLVKLFGSSKMELGARWYIYPSAFAAYSQGILQVNAGTYFSTFVSSPRAKNALVLQMGSWYRVGDEIIALIGFQVENIRLGLSVDLNSQTYELQKVNTESGSQTLPAYEISLTYNLNLSNPLGNVSSPIF